MRYDALIKNSSTYIYQGKRDQAYELAKQLEMYITYDNQNGYYIFTLPMQAVIYERDDSGKIVRQVNPHPYIKKEHPEYKLLTQRRVEALIGLLNKGCVNFDDVIEAELNKY